MTYYRRCFVPKDASFGLINLSMSKKRSDDVTPGDIRLSREVLGRIAGIFLFAGFLLFHLWFVLRDWGHLNAAARINSIIITCTIIFFLSSYFLRKKAVSYSKGFSETIYPLFCSSLPLVIYHDAELLRFIPRQNGYYASIEYIFGLSAHGFFRWGMLPAFFVITGNLIALAGIIYLKRSFSITAEARQPVFNGIYKYIRHPLYAGECIATLGVLIFRFSSVNIFLTVLFIICQVIRAGVEERKLMSAFPAYKLYRQKTGAFFPNLRQYKTE
jgi:hypothetical protein